MKNNELDVLCDFCGKNQNKVEKLIAGPNVYICNECIALCQEIIDEEKNNELEFSKGKYIHQLLTHHFYGTEKSEIESCNYDITAASAMCPGSIIDQWLDTQNYKYKRVGISRHYYGRDQFLTFSELWEEKIYPVYLGPTPYFLTGLNGNNSKHLKNGLWLCINEEMRFAIYMNQGRKTSSEEFFSVHIELAQKTCSSLDLTDEFFAHIKNISPEASNTET